MYLYIGIRFQEWEDDRLTWDKDNAATESEVAFALPTEIWWPEVFVDNSYVLVLAKNTIHQCQKEKKCHFYNFYIFFIFHQTGVDNSCCCFKNILKFFPQRKTNEILRIILTQ